MCTVHGYEIEIISIHKVNLPNCKISGLLDPTSLITWKLGNFKLVLTILGSFKQEIENSSS
jgi:hypothetical protein